jgi:hypothetical protein
MATPLDALQTLYNAVTPALPPLYVRELKVPADRVAPPYALLIHESRTDSRTQAGASVGGKTGLQSEILFARFIIWSFDSDAADTAGKALIDKLTPTAAVVTGAKTVMRATIDGPGLERRGQSRRAGAAQRPLGNVEYIDRLYAVTVGVRMTVDYT